MLEPLDCVEAADQHVVAQVGRERRELAFLAAMQPKHWKVDDPGTAAPLRETAYGQERLLRKGSREHPGEAFLTESGALPASQGGQPALRAAAISHVGSRVLACVAWVQGTRVRAENEPLQNPPAQKKVFLL